MNQLTPFEAIAFHDAGEWKSWTAKQRATFQIHQECLCMPFGEFHRAVEEALGRPVWTHEFGVNLDGLKAELAGQKDAPTMEEIIALLPAEKVVIVAA